MKYNLFWRPEPKKGKKERLLNIERACQKLGEDLCNSILFVLAFLGCDTTSRVFGYGKGVALKFA